ncbi:MAG: hypothetical protein RR075_05150, partial [Pygmaiobacter sp.]
MDVFKKPAFGISAMLAILFFVAIYPLSATQMAPYVLIFVAISVVEFAVVLYRALTKSFTQTNATRWIWIVSISALPHLLFSLLTYGSWICFGIAFLISVTLMM